MGQCAVKRGIITLRDCGAEATDTCVSCSRGVCREHMKIRGGEILCVECHARQEEAMVAESAKRSEGKQAPAPKSEREGDVWDDPSWAYTYRHHYYTTSSYSPFYTSSYYDSYYDTYDVRSFDQTADETIDEGDTGAGGFYDS